MYSSKNINIFRDFFREPCLKFNLLQLSLNMFCKNFARLADAREHIHVWQPLIAAKPATFFQNLLWESCRKFDFNLIWIEKMDMPVTAHPPHKRSFLPSKYAVARIWLSCAPERNCHVEEICDVYINLSYFNVWPLLNPSHIRITLVFTSEWDFIICILWFLSS